MFCEFEDTKKIYNNKKIYRCKNCQLEVALENPKTKIICFRLSQLDIDQQLMANDLPPSINHGSVEDATTFITQQAVNHLNRLGKREDTPAHETKSILCSEEEIKNRLEVCNKCEYYQNNSCILCGCTITRDKNYKNKLANKKARCPDNRWGPIN